jgi:Zn-dependent M28 family amino/carboxypeptidase
LDDGAACALLIRVAEVFARAPLARTTLEIALLSAEEIGVQGSRDFVRARLVPAAPSTMVINFEAIGAAADLAVFGSERFTLRSYRPDVGLVATLDTVHRRRRDSNLHVTWYGASTDARSFLAAGIPAATLTSDLPNHALLRHMHSAADTRARVDEAALDETLAYVLDVLTELDTRSIRSAPN